MQVHDHCDVRISALHGFLMEGGNGGREEMVGGALVGWCNPSQADVALVLKGGSVRFSFVLWGH